MSGTEQDPWRLREALAGDLLAWSDLVDEFGDTMWHWARSQGLGREDAEDVCQTVWYLLKDKGHTITDPRRLPGWLATTTRREAQAIGKKRARYELSTEGDEPDPVNFDDAGPDEIAVVSDLQQRLRAGFNALRTACRELLSLLWAGISYVDVAVTLGMAIGSIGETRRRCLVELRHEAGMA